MTDQSSPPRVDFIRNIIKAELEKGKHAQGTVYRFPPEPNGYLHIGHAKAICLNFGLAREFSGTCHLRFDDTNPAAESEEYTRAIQEDVAWLGCDWGGHLYYASDYFQKIVDCAVELIHKGLAYVDSLSVDEIRDYRGTLTEPGKNSPYRDRSVEENSDLFAKMKAGEFEQGEHCLRAKIDMSAGNINLRDPVIYRILKVKHHRSGGDWCIYPMYDFAHALSDAIESITYSLCTLEFQDHRPLYDWCIEHCDVPSKPRQIEFSRLNLNYTITSKRKLKSLVEDGHVASWDDPRMPTLSGLRRRGVMPESIWKFCEQVSVSKQDSVIDMVIFEQCIRDDLNQSTPRRHAVLRPLKVTIQNFADDTVETLSASNHPQQPDWGKREFPLSKTIYIDQDDFTLDPPPKYKRLAPGKEVRLLNAYVIRCDEVITHDDGSVRELVCTYDPDTLGGKKPADGRKVKGNIHWVSADHALDAQVRLYDRLFTVENPAKMDNFVEALNPNSLQVVAAKVEPSLATAKPTDRFQFNRVGYFCADSQDHRPGEKLVFNQIVTLRNVWA